MSGGLERRLTAGDHVVHFYDDPEAHVRTVSDHLGAALAGGDVVVIVARAARCTEFESGFAGHGLDVGTLRRDRRLVTVDADATLAQFMVGSSPDPDRFESVVGGLLRSVTLGGQVHVYGEMVSVLWEAGNVSGAIELEDLWVRLSSEMAFSLICGYASTRSLDSAGVDAFAEVCDRHSAVIGGAPVPVDVDHVRRFARSTHAPRAARRVVEHWLHEWGLDRVVADAVLIVAELAANAVMHAASDFTVGVAWREGIVRIVVGDTSPSLPTVRRSEPATVGGRGMRVVEKLSVAWGADLVADGKLVWVDLAVERIRQPVNS
jgi:hypothetical protein